MTLSNVFTVSVFAWLGVLAFFLWRMSGTKAVAVFAILAGGVVAGTGSLAEAGVLENMELPPNVLFVVGAVVILSVAMARPSLALSSSWTWLVGLQTFRIVVELLIHWAVEEGVSPPQLTWTGYNLDIVTGLTAPVVAWLAASGRIRWRGLFAWNIMGAALLAIVVTVAILSTPTPFQVLTPDNTWVSQAPYIWLPTVFVASALWLHVLSFRKLLAVAKDERS